MENLPMKSVLMSILVLISAQAFASEDQFEDDFYAKNRVMVLIDSKHKKEVLKISKVNKIGFIEGKSDRFVECVNGVPYLNKTKYDSENFQYIERYEVEAECYYDVPEGTSRITYQSAFPRHF